MPRKKDRKNKKGDRTNRQNTLGAPNNSSLMPTQPATISLTNSNSLGNILYLPNNVTVVQLNRTGGSHISLTSLLNNLPQRTETLGSRLKATILHVVSSLQKDSNPNFQDIVTAIQAFIDQEKNKLEDKTQLLQFSIDDFQNSVQKLIENNINFLRANITSQHRDDGAISIWSLSVINLVDYLEKQCQINCEGQRKNIFDYLVENQIPFSICWLAAAYVAIRFRKETAQNYLKEYIHVFHRCYVQENNIIKESNLIDKTSIFIILHIARELNDQQKFIELGHFCKNIIEVLKKLSIEQEGKLHKLSQYLLKKENAINELWLGAAKGSLFENECDVAENYLNQYKKQMIKQKSAYPLFAYYSAMALHAFKTNQPYKCKSFLTKAESLMPSILQSGEPAGHFLLCTYQELFTAAHNQTDFTIALYYAKGRRRLHKDIIWQYKKMSEQPETYVYSHEEVQGFISYHQIELKKFQKLVQTTKKKLFQEKLLHFTEILKRITEIELIRIEDFTIKIKVNNESKLSVLNEFLNKGHMVYNYQDDLLMIHHFYDFDNDKFARLFNLYQDQSECKSEVETIQPPNQDTVNNNNLAVNNDINNNNNASSSVPANPIKQIIFDPEYIYIKNSPETTAYKLRGPSSHRQYVCVSPQLLHMIQSTKGINWSTIIKGLFRTCDRGLVINNSKGRKGFVIVGNNCKLKDASKKIRYFGTLFKKVEDDQQKEHTLFRLDIFDPDHKLNFEKANAMRKP